MNTSNIDSVLAQMRAISEQSRSQSLAAPKAESPEFGRMLNESIAQVNELQQHAGQLKKDFEAGTGDASLPEVMVAVQKASLSFEAVTQVRNKLLAAYQEVMNMQV